MNTLSPDISAVYRVASAFPGRIRLQVALIGSSRAARLERTARLEQLASAMLQLAHAQSVETAHEASSLILRYDAGAQSLEAMLALAHQTAMQTLDAGMPAPTSAAAPSSVPAALPRVRTQGAQQVKGRALQRVLQKLPGEQEQITAYTLPPEKPRGLKSLIMPTVAVALSALEALPIAMVGAALAVATLPIAQRAAKRRSKSILSVDILDTVNIAVLALEGSFLPASVVTWLISLGELMRGETVLRSRRALLSAVHESASRRGEAPNAYSLSEQEGSVLTRLEHRTLSDTRLEDTALRSSRGLAWPAGAAAVFVFALSRDLGDLIGIIKPGKDFASATRFGLPTGLLNAMTQGYRQNIEFESGRALEALARADAFVFRSVDVAVQDGSLLPLVESLLERGAQHIVLPSNAGMDQAAYATELRQIHKITFVEYEAGTESRLLDALRTQGRNPALVDLLPSHRSGAAACAQVNLHPGDHSEEPENQEQHGNGEAAGQAGQESPSGWAQQAEEARFAEGDTEDAGELTLPKTPDTVTYRGPGWNLPIAIDIACQATAFSEQNTAIAGTAALFNFLTNVLRVSPAPLSTLVNTVTLALLSRNALRPLHAPAAPGPSRLPLLPPFRHANFSGQEADA